MNYCFQKINQKAADEKDADQKVNDEKAADQKANDEKAADQKVDNEEAAAGNHTDADKKYDICVVGASIIDNIW